MSSCFRNYNPVERRTKGCKERGSKGSNKSSKSLQANRLSGGDSADGGDNNSSGFNFVLVYNYTTWLHLEYSFPFGYSWLHTIPDKIALSLNVFVIKLK